MPLVKRQVNVIFDLRGMKSGNSLPPSNDKQVFEIEAEKLCRQTTLELQVLSRGVDHEARCK